MRDYWPYWLGTTSTLAGSTLALAPYLPRYAETTVAAFSIAAGISAILLSELTPPLNP